LKPFANDMLGTGNDFRGWQNYLEAPLTYCGLLCLLLFPQGFSTQSRRHKIVWILFLIGMLVPSVFPWFRYLFWLFQGDYYRTHSLFWILGVISLGAMALSRYLKGQALNLWLLAATTGLLLVILYLPFAQGQAVIDPGLRSGATIFLLAYGVFLAAGQLMRKRKLAAWLIVSFATLELVQFDQITVADRKTVKKEELKAGLAYNDEAGDALRDVMSSDDEKFFRITKLRPSGPSTWFSLNDAMVFGYYGTSSYSSFNNIHYTNFLTALDIIPSHSEQDTRWSFGLLNNPLMSLFACEKYALVDDPLPFQRSVQYEFVKRYEKDSLFRNARFLPFGLTFDRYLTEDVFLKLPAAEKPAMLLHAVVLSSEDEARKQGLTQTHLFELEQEARDFSLADVAVARLRPNEQQVEQSEEQHQQGFPGASEPKEDEPPGMFVGIQPRSQDRQTCHQHRHRHQQRDSHCLPPGTLVSQQSARELNGEWHHPKGFCRRPIVHDLTTRSRARLGSPATAAAP
jgi:uncharacterized membrane protein YfhO